MDHVNTTHAKITMDQTYFSRIHDDEIFLSGLSIWFIDDLVVVDKGEQMHQRGASDCHPLERLVCPY